MPQVDLETLTPVSAACAGGSPDSKIACETLAEDGSNYPAQERVPPEIPPDFPPDSFCLSKDAELDWFDRNAFYERKDSEKGNSNSTNLNLNLNLNLNPNPNPSSTSHRFLTSLKSKASIIGLPKPQKTIVDTKKKRNCKPENTRLFPKRSRSAGKSGSTVTEPSSPNVSCMGRVRSKRDRRRLKKPQQSGIVPETVTTKTERSGKTSFFATFRTIFRSGLMKRKESVNRVLDSVSPPRKSVTVINTHDIMDRLPRGDIDAARAESSPPRESVTREARKSVDGEPVGLGGMKRFTSGRRSDAWADDVF